MCTDACRKRITCTIAPVTVFYQQTENSNIANQIHGFTIHYSKFILICDVNMPVKVIPRIALRVPTAHDLRVISARKLVRILTQRNKFPSS